MPLQIPAEQMEQYKHARWLAEKKRRGMRRERAWHLVRQAATLLKEQYGVQRVAVFGPLTHSDRFSLWSDVDLAAWGLTPKNWLRAMAAARDLSDEVELNLVDVTCCSPELLAAIEREGVNL